MQKLKHLLLTATLLLCSLAASAHDFEVGGIYYNITSNTDLTVAVTYRDGNYASYTNRYSGTVTIPSSITYNGTMYRVTSVGSYAFCYCSSLTAITIPTSVTVIGESAFYGCSSLTSITIPKSVVSIQDYAFQSCSKLNDINIKGFVENIKINQFINTLWYKNQSDGILYLGEYLLGYKGEPSEDGDIWVGSVSVKAGTKYIADYALRICGLTTISIPSSVKHIGTSAFNAAAYPTGTAYIVDANNEVYSSYDGVLYDKAQTILMDCPANKSGSLSIPATVAEVKSGAFQSCYKISDIYCYASTPPVAQATVFFNRTANLYVPRRAMSKYAKADFWKDLQLQSIPVNSVASGTCGGNLTWNLLEDGELMIKGTGAMNDFSYGDAPWYKYRESIKAVTISEGVTSMGRYACLNCNKLVEVEISESVAAIGERAFEGCLLLPSVSIPNAVAEVGDAVFKDCYKLVSANLPEDIAYIPDWCFYNCTSLVAITIPEKVMSIGESSFINCMSLTNTHIPEGVTSIGDYAFNNCRNFTSVVIPDGVTAINDGVFQSCVNLASVVIPDGVVSIGSWAFYDCGVLTSVSIPESVTSIGKMAFYDCNAITAINIPEGVTEIGESVFYYCYNLTSITIPESVTSIGCDAFSACYGLTAIASEAIAPPVINQGAFSGVNKSIPLYVPAGSVAAYKSADYWKDFSNILPLPITITINQYGSGTYSSPYALDFREVKGLYAYAATGYNSDDNVVTFTRVKTAKAGTGLFIKGAPNTSYEVPILESTADNTLNMLVATLEKTNVDKYSSDGLYANYKYTLAPDDTELKFHPFANGSSLSAGKAYLQIPVAWLPVNDARSIRFRFDDGDGEDVDDGTTEMDNAEFGIQNSEIIYDLMGRRVASPQRGSLYIINGKKVIY